MAEYYLNGKAAFWRLQLWNPLWFLISRINWEDEPWAGETPQTDCHTCEVQYPGEEGRIMQHAKSDASGNMPQPALMCEGCSWKASQSLSKGFSSSKTTGAAAQTVVPASAAWRGIFTGVKGQRRKVRLSPTDRHPQHQRPCSHHTLGLNKWGPARAVPGQHHHSGDRE